MDKDRIKGRVKDIAGRVQEAWGDLTNDPEHKAEGEASQAEGKIQEKFGYFKDAARDARDRLMNPDKKT
jgi:uncharacterized protein YjbJ (UPF0337 family)